MMTFPMAKEFLPENNRMTVVEGDINDTKLLTNTILEANPNYVCHLAAMHFIPDCNANPTGALLANTVGTESVLNACKRNKIEKVLVASTAAVYPISNDPNVEAETEIAPIDIYGLSKMFVESLCQKFVRETGVDAIILRLFNAVGPRETNPHVIPHIFEMLNTSDTIPLGNISPKRDYIHTSDIAEAIYSLCKSQIRGYEAFNIGTGKEYSVEEVVSMLSEILDRRLSIRQDENRMRDVDRMHLVADINKVKSLVGWAPKMNIYDALKDTAKYYGLLSP